MNYFYFIQQGKYTICDPEMCDASKRTVDLSFENLALNSALLNLLNLWSSYASDYEWEVKTRRAYGTLEYANKKKHDAIKYFAYYLAAFVNKEGMAEKLMTNPTIRILFEDAKMLKTAKELIEWQPKLIGV